MEVGVSVSFIGPTAPTKEAPSFIVRGFFRTGYHPTKYPDTHFIALPPYPWYFNTAKPEKASGSQSLETPACRGRTS